MSSLNLGNLMMDDLVSEFFKNTRLAYISSMLPGYKVCGLLNKNYNFNFSRNCEMDIVIEKEVQQNSNSNDLFAALEESVPTSSIFPIYQYSIPHTHADIFLIGNQFQTEYLVPAMRHAQYFLLIRQYTAIAFDTDILDLFAAIDGIDHIKEIDLNNFDHKLALVFE